MTVVDAGGEFGGAFVGHAEHLEFGIEVVDVVKGERFGSPRKGGGAEFELAVVGGDEVEEMETDVFAGGLEGEPVFGGVGVEEVAPEFVDEFDAEGDVAEHFAVEGEVLSEAGFGILVFPELADVVEKDTSDEEIFVEARVDGADGAGGAHHLSDVLEEASAPGVVVFLGGGSTAKAVAELIDEVSAESFEARVFDLADHAGEIGPVLFLAAFGLRVADEESGDFLFVQSAVGPRAGIDAVLVLRPLAFESDGGRGGE